MPRPTRKPKTFADLYREAEQHGDCWVAGLVHDFTEALARQMEEQKVSRAELARRLGTSQAYVTQVLRGNVNFTLATLVKLARAVEVQLRLELCKPQVPADASVWPATRRSLKARRPDTAAIAMEARNDRKSKRKTRPRPARPAASSEPSA